MSVNLVILSHAERCACGQRLFAGVRAAWDDDSDEIVCLPCLELAAELDDVPPLDVSYTRAS